MAEVVGSAEIQLTATVSRLRRDLRQAERDTRRTAAAMQREAESAGAALGGAGRDLARGLRDSEEQSRRLNSTLRETSSLAALAAGAFAGVSVTGVVRLADEYANLQGRLRNVVGAGEDAGAIFDRLFASAQRNSAPVAELTGLYIRLRQAIGDLGDGEALALGETLAQTLALSGAGAAETEAFLRQISQALASGVLRGDEFNSVMESNARFARLLADYLGVGTGALRDMAQEGRLTADVIRSAAEGGAGEIRAEFEALPLTVSRAVQQLENALLRYVGGTDQGLGASQRLAEGIALLAENFNLFADAAIVAGAAALAAFTGRGLTAGINKVNDSIGAVLAAAGERRERALARAAPVAELSQRADDEVARIQREIRILNNTREAAERARQELRDGLSRAFERRFADANTAILANQRNPTELRNALAAREALVREYVAAEERMQRQIARIDAIERRATRAGLGPRLNAELGEAMRDQQRAAGALADAMVRVNAETSLQAQAANVARGAWQGLKSAGASLINLFGGPLGAALAVASVAFFVLRSRAEEAAASAAKVRAGLEVIASAVPAVQVASAASASAADAAGRLRDMTGEAAEAARELAKAQRDGEKATQAQADASAALAEVRRQEAIATVSTALAETERRRAQAQARQQSAGNVIEQVRALPRRLSGDEEILRISERKFAAATREVIQLDQSAAILRGGLEALQSGLLRVGSAATPTATQSLNEAQAVTIDLDTAARRAAVSMGQLAEITAEVGDLAGDPFESQVERARQIIEEARHEADRAFKSLSEIKTLLDLGVFAGLGGEAEAMEAMTRALEDMAYAAGGAAEALAILRGLDLPEAQRREAEERVIVAGEEGRERNRRERERRDDAQGRIFRPYEVGEDIREAVKDAMRNGDWADVFRDRLRSAAERAMDRAIDNVFDVLGEIFGAMKGGRGLESIIGAIGSSLFGVPGRAGGGPVSAGTAYQVGEFGRELFVPAVDGRILSASASRAAIAGAGAPSVAQVINIDARGADAGVEQRIRAAVEEATQRGALMGAQIVAQANRARSTL